jgi:hypothetical protein
MPMDWVIGYSGYRLSRLGAKSSDSVVTARKRLPVHRGSGILRAHPDRIPFSCGGVCESDISSVWSVNRNERRCLLVGNWRSLFNRGGIPLNPKVIPEWMPVIAVAWRSTYSPMIRASDFRSLLELKVFRKRNKFDGKTKQKVEPKSSSGPVSNRRDDAGGGRRFEAAKTVVQGKIRAPTRS